MYKYSELKAQLPWCRNFFFNRELGIGRWPLAWGLGVGHWLLTVGFGFGIWCHNVFGCFILLPRPSGTPSATEGDFNPLVP